MWQHRIDGQTWCCAICGLLEGGPHIYAASISVADWRDLNKGTIARETLLIYNEIASLDLVTVWSGLRQTASSLVALMSNNVLSYGDTPVIDFMAILHLSDSGVSSWESYSSNEVAQIEFRFDCLSHSRLILTQHYKSAFAAGNLKNVILKLLASYFAIGRFDLSQRSKPIRNDEKKSKPWQHYSVYALVDDL